MSYVVSTAQLQCPFGTAPSTLMVTNNQKLKINGMPVATMMDAAPMTNIMPFGMCITQTNPAVAAATAAALGVPTPAPCIPATSVWMSGAKASRTVNGTACVSNECTCMCAYGGNIVVTNPGQTKVN